MSDFTSTSQNLFTHVRLPASHVIVQAARSDAEFEGWLRAAAWARAGAGAVVVLFIMVLGFAGGGAPSSATAATSEPASHSAGYLPAQFTDVPYVDAAPIDTF